MVAGDGAGAVGHGSQVLRDPAVHRPRSRATLRLVPEHQAESRRESAGGDGLCPSRRGGLAELFSTVSVACSASRLHTSVDMYSQTLLSVSFSPSFYVLRVSPSPHLTVVINRLLLFLNCRSYTFCATC